jgi:hypothetical protein
MPTCVRCNVSFDGSLTLDNGWIGIKGDKGEYCHRDGRNLGLCPACQLPERETKMINIEIRVDEIERRLDKLKGI